MPDRGPGLLANIAWATAAVLTIPAITAATRIKQITFEPAPTPRPRPARAAGGGGGGGWLPDFIFNAALFGFMFVLVDEYAGVDLLYRTFGLDILPKSQTQKTSARIGACGGMSWPRGTRTACATHSSG